MSARCAIVVVIDRLGASALGPYGNTWLDTPQFNRLASQSLLVETALADSPDLTSAYRAYWSGRHVLEPLPPHEPGLPASANGAGLKTILLTDEPAVAEHPLAAGFAERTLVPPALTVQATELEQTSLFRLLAEATSRLSAAREPMLFWLHARGLAGPWDAPPELRRQFADDEDPLPPDFIEPPNRLLPNDFDPDELLGIVHAHAGQISLLDACLGLLLDGLEEHPLAGETLLVVTSPRGYPLGEHRRVGVCDDALYGELLHVPLFVRLPDYTVSRMQRIVQPASLHATLTDWLSLSPSADGPLSLLSMEEGDEEDVREDIVCCVAPGQRAIRTRAWFMREVLHENESQRELYAKPDDRYEVNEVSSRAGEVVELLAARLDAFHQSAAAGELAAPAPLAELLTDVWR